MVYRVVGDGAPGKAALMPAVVLASNSGAGETSWSLRRRGLPPPAGSAVDRRTRRLRTLLLSYWAGSSVNCAGARSSPPSLAARSPRIIVDELASKEFDMARCVGRPFEICGRPQCYRL